MSMVAIIATVTAVAMTPPRAPGISETSPGSRHAIAWSKASVNLALLGMRFPNIGNVLPNTQSTLRKWGCS